jgi:hypothetical protein
MKFENGAKGESKMKFMMIVKATKDFEEGKPLNRKLLEVVGKLAEEQQEKGILITSGGLMPSSAGARINVAGKKVTVIDGPFAETKELVGGFAIIEARSREHAIELGKDYMQVHAEIMGPEYEGELEVRAIFNPADACGGANNV